YPPPPPAPVRAQGAPPGGIPPVPANFNPQGQPGGPAPRTGLSSQNPQIPNSGRSVFVNSSRIVDVTQPVKLDEAECRKKFTTYAVYTVKKAPPPNPRADLTWARAEVVEERLDYGATLKQIKNLNEASRKSVGKKMAELGFNQGAQVSRILDELINKEKDQNFVWTLAQIGKQERLLKSKSSSKRDSPKRETTEHQYFAEDRRRSPSPRSYRHDMPALQPSRPTHVPQMPRAHHAIDPVIAAYQAGKEDAAEQFGLDERERHVPPPRAIPRPVVIEQPQAVISYVPGRREGFAEPRYPGRPSVQRLTETRYSPPLTLPQFSEERYFDPRRAMRQERRNFRRDPLDYLSESEFSSEPGFSPIRRDFRGGSDYHDREREAQDYID
ncbi:hypothetical protein BJ875DRAFT_346800, partial [Amylocarpus encephaloides]